MCHLRKKTYCPTDPLGKLPHCVETSPILRNLINRVFMSNSRRGIISKPLSTSLRKLVFTFLDSKEIEIKNRAFIPTLENLLTDSIEIYNIYKVKNYSKAAITNSVRHWLEEKNLVNVSELKRVDFGLSLSQEEIDFLEEQNINWNDMKKRYRYDWSWLDSDTAIKYFISLILPFYLLEPKISKEDLIYLGFNAFVNVINKKLGLNIKALLKLTQDISEKEFIDMFGKVQAKKKFDNANEKLTNLRLTISQKQHGNFYTNRDFLKIFNTALKSYVRLLNVENIYEKRVSDFFINYIHPGEGCNIFESIPTYKRIYYRQPEYIAASILFIIFRLDHIEIYRRRFAQKVLKISYSHFENNLLSLYNLLDQRAPLDIKLIDGIWKQLEEYLSYDVAKIGFEYNINKLSLLNPPQIYEDSMKYYFSILDNNMFPIREFFREYNVRASCLSIKGSVQKRRMSKSTISIEYLKTHLITPMLKNNDLKNYDSDHPLNQYVKSIFNYYKVNDIKRPKNMHPSILRNMLEDNKTPQFFVTELPIWARISPNKFYTGHIDIIGFEDNVILIMDYKMNEDQIIKHLPQVASYGLIFKRILEYLYTKYSLDKIPYEIKCVSFCESVVYTFNPFILKEYILPFIKNLNIVREESDLPRLTTKDFSDLEDDITLITNYKFNYNF